MNIKSRIEKLEKVNHPQEFVCVALAEGETPEEAEKNCDPVWRAKYKYILWLDQDDVNL